MVVRPSNSATLQSIPSEDEYHSDEKVAKVEAKTKELQNLVENQPVQTESPGLSEAQDKLLTKSLEDISDISNLADEGGKSNLSDVEREQAYVNAEIERFNSQFQSNKDNAKAKMIKRTVVTPPRATAQPHNGVEKETATQKSLRKKYLKLKARSRDARNSYAYGLNF